MRPYVKLLSSLLKQLLHPLIIIIIQYLFSALKSFKGYRGAGGFRLRLSKQVFLKVLWQDLMSDGSEFQVSGAATENARRANSVHVLAADGHFNHIRQVAAICPPMRSHWRHLANAIELVLPSAHQSPQPKRKYQLTHFCTALRRVSSCTWAPPSEYNWTCAFFGLLESTTQTASRSVQPFLHSWRQIVPILYNGRLYLPKLPLLIGSGPHLILFCRAH